QVNEYFNDQLPIQFSEESLRVVKKMPKWKPAMHKGKKVNCRMNLPIMFKKN
ncbi:MAG: energy transducer TonB, partial [Saprospiraceae bacterium]|nr:energy transducer TonB [Saprospiraceae bacterium]